MNENAHSADSAIAPCPSCADAAPVRMLPREVTAYLRRRGAADQSYSNVEAVTGSAAPGEHAPVAPVTPSTKGTVATLGVPLAAEPAAQRREGIQWNPASILLDAPYLLDRRDLPLEVDSPCPLPDSLDWNPANELLQQDEPEIDQELVDALKEAGLPKPSEAEADEDEAFEKTHNIPRNLPVLDFEGRHVVVVCDGCAYVVQAAIARLGSVRHPVHDHYRGVYLKWRIQQFAVSPECCKCHTLKLSQAVAEYSLVDGREEYFTSETKNNEFTRRMSGADDPGANHPHWLLDTGGPSPTPFWDDPEIGSTRYGETGRGPQPAVLRDFPGRIHRDRQINYGLKLITLAMCEEYHLHPDGSYHTAHVVVHVRWGFYFDSRGDLHVDVPEVGCGSTPEADEALRRWDDYPGTKGPFRW